MSEGKILEIGPPKGLRGRISKLSSRRTVVEDSGYERVGGAEMSAQNVLEAPTGEDGGLLVVNLAGDPAGYRRLSCR